MPKVSVIIPNYNHAIFLKQRIDSVLNQTYKDFEVIILDDCSTDNSKEVIEGYRSHPAITHIVYNEKNSGSPFEQWNKGLKLAEGEYIWIAESDDLSDCTFLQILVAALQNHPGSVLAYCRSRIIDEKGISCGLHMWMDALDDSRWTQDFINSGSDEISQYLRFRNTIPNASGVVFKNLGGIRDWISTEKVFSGDWQFWISILRKGDIYYYSKPLNLFRMHSNTTRDVKRLEVELSRIREYFDVIKFASSHKFKYSNNYNWIIEEWLTRFKRFRHCFRYYFPTFPISMYPEFYIKLLKLILKG